MRVYAAGDGRCVALIIGSFGVCVVVGVGVVGVCVVVVGVVDVVVGVGVVGVVIHVVFCCRLFIDVLVCACDCRHVRFIVAAGGSSRCDV